MWKSSANRAFDAERSENKTVHPNDRVDAFIQFYNLPKEAKVKTKLRKRRHHVAMVNLIGRFNLV